MATGLALNQIAGLAFVTGPYGAACFGGFLGMLIHGGFHIKDRI